GRALARAVVVDGHPVGQGAQPPGGLRVGAGPLPGPAGRGRPRHEGHLRHPGSGHPVRRQPLRRCPPRGHRAAGAGAAQRVRTGLARRDGPDRRVSTLGLLLAAGRGSRMGSPKALVRGADGVPWLLASRSALLAAGCDRVLVVRGAQAEAAVALLPAGAEHVVAADWTDGMSASLRTGLEAARSGPADAVLVHLVDLPD